MREDGDAGRHLVGRLQGGPVPLAPAPGYGEVDYWYMPPAQEESTGDFATTFRQYLAVLIKRKFLIAGCTLAAVAVGIALTLLMTPIYTAQATLQIDREAARVVAGQDVQPQEQMTGAEEFFQTQYGLLRSRSLAKRVSESLGLARDARFLTSMGLTDVPSDPVKRQEQVVDVLQANFNVDPVRGSRLAVLTFDSPAPQLSANIANAFAENFISSNLERRFESSSYARDFLEKRLAQVKDRLEESERQLVAYASSRQIINLSERESGADPGQTQSLQQADLVALNTSLAAAKASRIAAEQRWRQAQATQNFGGAEILTSPTIQQLSQSLAKAQTEYQEKLLVFKPDFPAMLQLKAQIDESQRQLEAERGKIAASVKQTALTDALAAYNIARNEESALQARVNQLKSAVLDVRGRSIEYNILQREVDTNRQLYDGLLQRYKEVGVAGGITSNNLSIVDRAEPPRSPSKPRPLVNAVLSLLLGFGAGVALAILVEALDQAVRRPQDIETKLGLPLLGTIPRLDKGVTPVEALSDIRSSYSEAHLSLATALQFSTKTGLPSTLLITSSRPAEGKSSTAYACAQSFARIGKRVLIVDADLRNPSLHKLLGSVENARGLSSLLIGKAGLADVVVPTPTDNLQAVTSGPLPPNPAELLAGGALRVVLGEAAAMFDLVIIDGPPILGLADAPLISSLSQGTVLVVEAGTVGRNQVRASLRRLQLARGKLVGVVVTKFNAKQTGYGYGYGYNYEYSYGSRIAQQNA